MNAFLQAQAALIAAAAETGPNMTEAQKGGGGGRLLPEGYAFGQLVEYVEFGSQPQEYQGVAKDPAPTMQLGFALSGEGYSNEDGTPYLTRTYTMAMSRNDKAKAFLLFKSLNWKATATHFAQLLGQKFLVKIVHTKPDAAAQAKGAKPRSTIDLKGFLPPLDPVTRQPYAIPEAPDSMYKLFLWEHPSLEGWNALHIDGEFEAKDGKPARSKNFVQEEILGAVDFPGSPLEQLLLTNNITFNRPAPKPVAAAPAPAAPAAPAAAPAMPAVPAVAATPAPAVPATASPALAAVPSPSVPAASPAATPAPAAAAVPSVPAMPAMPAMPKAA